MVNRAPNPLGPTAVAAAGYALLFWASVLWFGVTEPDWMLSYMIPAQELPMIPVQIVFAIALVLSALSGHTLTAVCLQRNRTATAAAVTASGAAVWMGLWAFTLDRYLQVGTHAEFATGATVALQQSTMVGAMNAAGAVQGLAGAALLARLYTAGKRLKAR